MQTLLYALSTGQNVDMSFTYSFTREQPASSPTTSGRISITLSADIKAQLYNMLSTNQTGTWNIKIPKAFPRAYRLPLTEPVSPISEMVGMQLSLSRKLVTQMVKTASGVVAVNSIVLAWAVTQEPTTVSSDKAPHKHDINIEASNDLFTSAGPQLVTLSTMVPTDSLTIKVMATGIVGLYITVVLSVGRFIRISLSRLVPKIRYEDLPNVEFIISLCEDLFIARQFGNLLLEEELYWELIELYRDPSLILEVTGRRPVLFKHKPD